MLSFAEKYFDMPKKQCREALDFYKKFLSRMDRVSEFLKVAEVSGTLTCYEPLYTSPPIVTVPPGTFL